MEFITSIFTNGAILAGGATGLLGTIVSGILGYFERRQRHKQELELRQIDLQIAQTRSKFETTTVDAARGIENQSLNVPYQTPESRWSTRDSKWLLAVDIIRGLVRPVITVGVLILIGVVYFSLDFPVTAENLGIKIVDTLLYVLTTAVLWWFGTRPIRYNK